MHIYILLLLFGYGCIGPDLQLESSKQNVDYLIEQGQILWEQRTDKVAADKAAHFISLAHEQRPEDLLASLPKTDDEQKQLF